MNFPKSHITFGTVVVLEDSKVLPRPIPNGERKFDQKCPKAPQPEIGQLEIHSLFIIKKLWKCKYKRIENHYFGTSFFHDMNNT